MSLSRWSRCLVAAVVCGAGGVLVAATPQEVGEAIKKGREWLLSQQENGNWEKAQVPTGQEGPATEGGQWGGMTALATYALLASGEQVSNPKVQDAIKFLRDADIKGVYALGMRAQVWNLVPKVDWVNKCIDRDASLLLEGVLQTPDNTGLYNYLTPAKPDDTRVDHSVSQYGVLGTWALENAGAKIPPKYWQLVEDVWRNHQDRVTGGWCYDRMPKDDHPVSMSMTAAGVATLFITQQYLHAEEGLQPRGNISNREIDAGLKWIADNFDSAGQDWYAWYGIERIGVASGRKYFGKNNWYEIGAERMVRSQQPDGTWTWGWMGRGDVIGTSFCLLALSRGRAPVMMGKLEYQVVDAKGKTVEGLWNQRPRDVANIARWVGRRVERDLNWQVVNLDVPDEELTEAPILYISGSAALNLSDAHKQKLKAFVENGGMILGNPDAGRPQFTDSFKKLGESLFPAYKFRELPEKHPIYTDQQFQRTRWKIKPSVWALGNGAREFMIVVPQVDPARQWQVGDDRKREDLFQLPADIFMYSVDKGPQFKGERVLLKADPSVATEREVKVARLQYAGNWDPEPGGWRRLAASMRNNQHVDLKVEAVKLGDGKLDATYRMAHLTGTEAIKLTDKEKEELKDYVNKGGVLVVDAAGGKGEFRAAVETDLTSLFAGDNAKVFAGPLKLDSALYTAMGDASKGVEYRPYARTDLGKLPKDPHLRAAEVNGKYRVIYSPMDMTTGLNGQPVDGIVGYSPKSATDLMAALVVYSAQ